MKRFLSLTLALLCAVALADTTIDTPVPTQCAYTPSGGTPVTIVGGTADQCIAAAKAAAPLGTTQYAFSPTTTANITNAPAPPPPPGGYSTVFPTTGLLAGGDWLGGKSQGVNWSDMTVTSPGTAIGTQIGNGSGNAKFADSTALLSGSWPANVTATIQTYWGALPTGNNVFRELEIRLRSTMTAGNSSGYECTFGHQSGSQGGYYVQVNRWNGALGSYAEIDGRTVSAFNNGDVFKCSASGPKITAYVNGMQKLQVTDSTFPNGAPGIGAYFANPTNQQGLAGTFGITSFTVTTP